jgi:hypothetical protein
VGVAEMLAELAKREKQAGIFPEKDVDVYMKVRFYSCNSLESLWDYPVESLILSKLLNALLNDVELYFGLGVQATAVEGMQSSLSTDYIMKVTFTSQTSRGKLSSRHN